MGETRACLHLDKKHRNDRCHSRENGNPVGILLLDSGSAPGMTQNRPLFGLEMLIVNTPYYR